MKSIRLLATPLAAFLSLSFAFGASEPDFKNITPNVAELLEKAHYSRRKLDDTVSKQFLKNYVEMLDYNRLFFTQKDIDNFSAKYGTVLDDDLLLGNVEPALGIFAVYKKRVEDRVVKVKELLNKEYDFSSDRTVEFNRQKSPWAKDEEEADQLWRDRVEGEMLDRKLMDRALAKDKEEAKDKDKEGGKDKQEGKDKDGEKEKGDAKKKDSKENMDSPVKVVTRRYDQLLRNIHEQEKEDIVSTYLSVLAQTYDPHSEYMSKAQLESFSINMRLSLVGIGAVLTTEEGYAKIRELMPGGPAAEDGRLKVGDRISGVAQGDADFVETIDMRLDKVVEMIRGKKDTIVRLKIIPHNATDPSERKEIDITRREVKLKEQEAKAELIERPRPDGTMQRLGWITLPSFYADMEHSGQEGAKSTTKDVLALLNRLKEEKIEGLVMDLRRDGGGSLEEAVNLTGLFIKSGPVVVARDSNGKPTLLKDRDKSVAYEGPMIVLCNRLSASASEIFAAALQDYNRAVIVGDTSTFGKGTVQTMVEIGRVLPLSLGGNNDAGALKLTIQKFYRIVGGSTQLKGVLSDIRIPSIYDQVEIGESALKGPMPYDTIEAVPFTKNEQSLYKEQLKQRADARIAADPEFQWIKEDLDRATKRMAENKVPLNEKVRRTELDEGKARKEQRSADRSKIKHVEEKLFALTLDNVAKPELEPFVEKKEPKEDGKEGVKEEKKEKEKEDPAADPDAKKDDADDDEDESPEKSPRVDPVRNEAVNILNDLVEFWRTPPPPVADGTRPNTAAVK